MFKRQAAALFAACTLFVGGFARAEQPGNQGTFDPLASAPLTLDDQATSAPAAAEPAAPSGPGTGLLSQEVDKTPLGKTFKDWGLQIGGFIEGSYTYDMSHNSNFIAGRVFDFENEALRMNQLALQFARVMDTATDLKNGKWDFGFGLDMMYGSDGRLIHGNGLDGYNSTVHPINQFDLTQAYFQVFIPVGHGLTVEAGKFVTPLGYETIAPVATVTGSSGNPFYSHSFSFGFGIPFTQTGVTFTYPLNDKWTAMAGFTRGWNQAVDDNNGAIDFLGELTYAMSKQWNFVINTSIGPQMTNDNSDYTYLVEGIAKYTPNDKWLFAADGLFAADDHAAANGDTGYWYGITGYVGYKLNKFVTLNGRAEWFRDDGGAVLGTSVSAYEVTGGATITPLPDSKWFSNLIIRPEIRGDFSNKDVFNGGKDKSQATAAVDAVFSL